MLVRIIFGLLGLSINNVVGSIISAAVGACLIIFIGRKVFNIDALAMSVRHSNS